MDTAYTYRANDGTIKHAQYRIAGGVPTTKPGHRGPIRVLVSQTAKPAVPFFGQLTLAQATKSK
jgi:hypothetical protein